MSYLKTKQALIDHLLANLPTGLTDNDVAFENRKFKPSNKSLWLSADFIPATTKALGKTDSDGDDQRGIFQISVFVALNNPKFDSTQLAAIDELITAFKYNTTMVYNTQTVYLSNSTVNNGRESGAWFQRDISINYFTFSNRG